MRLRQTFRPTRVRIGWPWPAHWALAHRTVRPCTHPSRLPKPAHAPLQPQVEAAAHLAHTTGSVTLWHVPPRRRTIVPRSFNQRVMVALHAAGATCTIRYLNRDGTTHHTRRMENGLLLKEPAA